MTRLVVWTEGQRVGELDQQQGRWRFQYDPAWIADSHAYDLSPHLPRRAESFVDSADDKRIEWYFENLLPEGGLREAMARQARVSARDAYGLLTRFGRDVAGALTVLGPDEPYPADDQYAPLSRQMLRRQIEKSAGLPLLAANAGSRMSLAGTQNKLGVLCKEQEFYLPLGAAPSSHIIKPDNANARFEFCPANEYFCMALARRLGLEIPAVTLYHLPEPLYCVTRFDRVFQNDHVHRRHQIDLCQLLNKWVGYKYESEGGIGFEELAAAIKYVVQPAVARDRLLRWTVFNYLIGNHDAHAKNVAFLVSSSGIVLAPAYDLLCTAVYLPESLLAMTIGGENRPRWIEAKHWASFAQQLRVPARLVHVELARQSEKILDTARQLAHDELFTEPEQRFLDERLIPIFMERAGYVREVIKRPV